MIHIKPNLYCSYTTVLQFYTFSPQPHSVLGPEYFLRALALEEATNITAD